MNRILFYMIAVALLSCNSANIMNGPEPSRESFKYYNKDFKFNKNSRLRPGQKYYFDHPGGKGTSILVFFEDGFLNKYFTTGINGVSGQRSETGTMKGYYEMKGDSVFFTTKSYYQRKETTYAGILLDDTLVLNVKYPKNKNSVIERFYLYK